MRTFYKLLIFAIAMLFGAGVMAQTPVLVPFGGSRPIDTAYAARSLRIDSVARWVKYATNDTNKVLGVTANGTMVLRDKAGGYTIPTLQQVATAGNSYTGSISVNQLITNDLQTNGPAYITGPILYDVPNMGEGRVITWDTATRELRKSSLFTDSIATKSYVNSHSSSPAGTNRQIQFNNNGVFGADTALNYTSAGVLKVGKATPTSIFQPGQILIAIDSGIARLNVYNSDTTGYSTLRFGESNSNQSFIANFNSAFPGVFSGTSIDRKNALCMINSTSLSGELPIVINGKPTYIYSGFIPTNMGMRLDTIGIRFGLIQGLHTENTIPFLVEENMATAKQDVYTAAQAVPALGKLYKQLADSTYALKDTIFISQIPGIHQNSNLSTGGGTSDRLLIQAVLDLNPKVLIQDGVSLLDSTLIVGSNILFTGLGSHTGFYLDTGSRSFMIINRGGYAGNAGIVDSNITISNMFLNGNGMAQIDPVNGGSITGGYGINIINMFGVNNLRMDGITTTKGAQWGIGLFNVKNSFINNHVHLMDWTYYSHYTVGQYTAGKVPLSQDAINFRGGCENIIYTNARISSSDDAIAINPIRYAGDPVGLNHDPIRHIILENIILENSALGIAVYSDTLVEDIHTNNVSGRAQWRWGYVGANSAAAGQIIDYNGGNQRNVTFSNINVTKIDTFANTFNYQSPYFFVVDGNTRGTFSIDGYNVDSMQSYPYLFRQLAGFTSEQITITNMNMVDRNNATSGYPRIGLDGGIFQFNMNNMNWYRNGTLNQQGRFCDINNGVINFNATDIHLHNVDTAFTIVGTNNKNVVISDFVMDSCATDGGILSISAVSPVCSFQFSNIYAGVTPILVGSGASNAVNNGLIRETHIGLYYGTDGRATSFSGWRLGGGAIANLAPPSGGFSGRPIGLYTNDGNTFLAGMSFDGTGTSTSAATLTNIGFGYSTTLADIYLTKLSSQAVNYFQAANGNISLGNGASDGGSKLFVNGTVGITGATTITNASNAFFNLRRDINNNGAGNDITWILKNSVGTYVNYAVISGQIVSNTNGSHTGRLVFAPASGGTITERMHLTSDGHLLLGTFTNSTFTLDVQTGTTRLAGNVTMGAKMILYNNSAITNGQLLIGHTANGAFEKATLTAGAGIAITNGAGTITIDGALSETITNTSAGTLSPAVNTHYFFTGTTSTWTLPAVSGNTNNRIKVKNVGSGTVTINSNAGGNDIFSSSAVNTFALTSGSYVELVNNGTYWGIE